MRLNFVSTYTSFTINFTNLTYLHQIATKWHKPKFERNSCYKVQIYLYKNVENFYIASFWLQYLKKYYITRNFRADPVLTDIVKKIENSKGERFRSNKSELYCRKNLKVERRKSFDWQRNKNRCPGNRWRRVKFSSKQKEVPSISYLEIKKWVFLVLS